MWQLLLLSLLFQLDLFVLLKKHITNMILKKKPKVVGVYRLTMKKDSDNFRFSSMGFEIVHDLELFKNLSDIILVNRINHELDDVSINIYTRDIFSRD